MVHEAPDIQHRGVHIIMNMVESDKEVAQRIVESNMFEVNSKNLEAVKNALHAISKKYIRSNESPFDLWQIQIICFQKESPPA